MARWTGNGVADGQPVTTANVGTAGNQTGTGTVTRSVGGSPSMLYAGNGFSVEVPTTSSDLARLIATVTFGKGLVAQLTYTHGSHSSRPLEPRNASAPPFAVVTTNTGVVQLLRNGGAVQSTSPTALTLGHKYQIDVVLALSAVPSSSNGRFFVRIKGLTDTSWNTTGDWFVDTGYAIDLGTADFTSIRFGKNATALATPLSLFEHLGWDPVTVNPADLSRSAAEAYFMGTPSSASSVTGSASSTGGGAGAASGVRRTFATAASSGTGAGTVAAVRRTAGSGVATGGGAGSASGVRRSSGTAASSGGGSAQASGGRRVSGSGASSGGGTASASGGRVVRATAAASGGGTASATGVRRIVGTAAGTNGGQATAAGVVLSVKYGTATATGTGAASASGLVTHAATARATGAGTATATGRRTIRATVTGSGNGTATAAGLRKVVGTAYATGSGIATFNVLASKVTYFTVAPEQRIFPVPAETRTFTVPTEQRHFTA